MAKLCPRGKAAAKRKFKVYPSAYANMYASGVCSGKITPGGKKSSRKKAAGGGFMSRRMNRLEELGRVDAEKARTRKGKSNLRAEKKRIVRELNRGSRGVAKRGFGKEMR